MMSFHGVGLLVTLSDQNLHVENVRLLVRGRLHLPGPRLLYYSSGINPDLISINDNESFFRRLNSSAIFVASPDSAE